MTSVTRRGTLRLMRRNRTPMVNTSVRLAPQMLEELNEAADEMDVYAVDVIRVAVTDYLSRRKAEQASTGADQAAS